MVPAPGGALLAALFAAGLAAAGSSNARGQLVAVSQPGMCLYGSRLDCCYGWKKTNKGHCEAICGHGCKYGECMGPNKCKCFPGFTGKTCSEDLNECGLKPRPCEHRCMNTHGSYKCYCLNGYMLMPDGTCASSRTCALVNCQYGCEEVKQEVQCLCPSSGLQLGPNRKTCIDIDECSTGVAVCSYNRRCINTFGSYYCKCQLGYELKYISGHYGCVDVNECVTNTHRCNVHAECLNTKGSFKCKCKQGYQGSGFDCAVIPEKSVKEIARIPGTAKDTIKKILAHRNSVKNHETIKNLIPEAAVTPSSKTHLQLLNYEDDIDLVGSYSEEEKETEEEETEESDEKEEEDFENQIDHEQSLRGDVFFPKLKETAAFGLPLSRPEQEGLKMSDQKNIVERAHCIEKLLSENNFQDIEDHLKELEDIDMTIEYLQGTEVAKAVYRVLKSCPSVELKKKAKQLLSRWKGLYKNNCVRSMQVKKSACLHVEEEHLNVVPREQSLSEGPCQQEALDATSSKTLFTSPTVQNMVCSNTEGSINQLSSFKEHTDNEATKSLVNEAGLRQDLMRALRCKCTDLLYKALTGSAKDEEKTDKCLELAKEIEEHIFALHAKNDRKYKNCIRSKISNLKNPKTCHLKHNLFSGTLTPKAFAEMTVMEMASDELKQLRALYTESSVQEHQLPQVTNGTQTNKIKCRRCEKFDCNVTMISRGTLFLPGWVQNTNPDEQMLTYVICNKCGDQWYHSRWICL